MSNFIPILPISGVPDELIRVLNERLRELSMTNTAAASTVQAGPSKAAQSDAVQGASNLTTTGNLPKVMSGGRLIQSTVTDDGTNVRIKDRNILFDLDNAYDIGAIAATRPRNINAGSWLSAGSALSVAGVQVVGAQQPAIAGPSGGSVIDIQARNCITTIIAELHNHGLIG